MGKKRKEVSPFNLLEKEPSTDLCRYFEENDTEGCSVGEFAGHLRYVVEHSDDLLAAVAKKRETRGAAEDEKEKNADDEGAETGEPLAELEAEMEKHLDKYRAVIYAEEFPGDQLMGEVAINPNAVPHFIRLARCKKLATQTRWQALRCLGQCEYFFVEHPQWKREHFFENGTSELIPMYLEVLLDLGEHDKIMDQLASSIRNMFYCGKEWIRWMLNFEEKVQPIDRAALAKGAHGAVIASTDFVEVLLLQAERVIALGADIFEPRLLDELVSIVDFLMDDKETGKRCEEYFSRVLYPMLQSSVHVSKTLLDNILLVIHNTISFAPAPVKQRVSELQVENDAHWLRVIVETCSKEVRRRATQRGSVDSEDKDDCGSEDVNLLTPLQIIAGVQSATFLSWTAPARIQFFGFFVPHMAEWMAHWMGSPQQRECFTYAAYLVSLISMSANPTLTEPLLEHGVFKELFREICRLPTDETATNRDFGLVFNVYNSRVFRIETAEQLLADGFLDSLEHVVCHMRSGEKSDADVLGLGHLLPWALQMCDNTPTPSPLPNRRSILCDYIRHRHMGLHDAMLELDREKHSAMCIEEMERLRETFPGSIKKRFE